MRTHPRLVLLLCILLGGCAAAPALSPIANGQAVSITVSQGQNPGGPVDIQNTALGEGMSVGMGSGLVIGGLWGLSCGPLAILCVPLGAATGVLAGGATGAAVGATGALAGEKAEQVRARLARLETSHPLLAELQQNLGDRARKHWKVSPEATANVVTVELKEFRLASTRDEQLRFAMRVLVSQREAPDGRAPRGWLKTYEYVSPYASMAVWLDERSDYLDTSLTSANQHLASQIIADLMAK